MEPTLPNDQLKHIKAIVERAANDPDRTGTMRKDAFKRLIELTHSPHSSLKSYAAEHIQVFFGDFPDLEEVAINAVYDLCEDQDSQVRIGGYRAVTRVSQAQRRWVKRNADVLVQLLQSDEPEEVEVVKAALLQHLEMDPPLTLGVLCDQIVPPEQEVDEYERQTRDRIRSLVVSFLATDASGAIVQKHTDPPGAEAEQVLVDQLLLSLRRLDTRDVGVIVKDILLRLPCYRKTRARGDALLQVLLNRAVAPLQTRSSDPVSLKTTLFFLSLAQTVVVDRAAGSLTQLLRFYITNLTPRITLRKFPQADRVTIISWIAEALLISETNSGVSFQQAGRDELLRLRRQAVDACPILLEVLFDSKPHDREVLRAVKSFIHIINSRKERESWAIPSSLDASIRKFQTALNQDTQEDTGEIQGLIRSLLEPRRPSTSQEPVGGLDTRIKNGNVAKRPAHLPPRPVASPPSPSQLKEFASERAIQQSAVQHDTRRQTRGFGTLTSPKRPNDLAEDNPQAKKLKTNSKGRHGLPPSLLSRIADDDRPSSVAERIGQKRGRRHSRESTQEPDKHPMGGYSIKGAATAQRVGNSRETTLRHFSLLDRLENSNSMSRSDEGSGQER
ncbi:apoptosis inhibitory protein 5-domain-containing protein [Phlebopus sp. FC_14]|nr:apoptosis inhibitory protein 5-domain-containing protein [Phlebopus sp. FC_14]